MLINNKNVVGNLNSYVWRLLIFVAKHVKGTLLFSIYSPVFKIFIDPIQKSYIMFCVINLLIKLNKNYTILVRNLIQPALYSSFLIKM